MGKRSLEAICY